MSHPSRLSESTFATFYQGAVETSLRMASDVDGMMCECLERLSQAGDHITPADLVQYLPKVNEVGEQARRFVLVELIKLNMAMASESGHTVSLDDYFVALPELITAATAPLDLVMEEIQLRRDAGQPGDVASYRDRFPQFIRLLEPLLNPSTDPQAGSSAKVKKKTRDLALLPAGLRIDDFEIIQLLGSGAFAHVYLARQLSMSRLVALKISQGTGDESKALAQFDHPNIVRVFDQRSLASPSVRLLYMQFHPGGTLAEVVAAVREIGSLKASGRLLLQCVDNKLLASAQLVPERSIIRSWIADASWPKVVAWLGVQLARALQDAHDNGVLHRDVKPANVLLTAEGVPQLADFNVSIAQIGHAGRQASSLGGSVGYMAPEHLRAITANWMTEPPQVGESADLYSLGVLLWELWQGARPFDCCPTSDTWTAMVHDQLISRDREFVEPIRDGTASQRVLESVLRSSLSPDPSSRPSSGAEMAGSLRLALHPEAAKLFDPDKGTWASLFSRLSPWYVAVTLILLPNMAAGWFHFTYNRQEIMTDDKQVLDEISRWVNVIVFPVGAMLVVIYTAASVRALRNADAGKPMNLIDLKSCLNLGARAAVIDGGLWLIAGIVFPIALWVRLDEFTFTQASHFFVSSLMCGGVAMVYPFFTITLLCVGVYYPRIVRPTMQDVHFEANSRRIISYSESFFLVAALLPLLAAALMISSNSQSREFMLTAIVAGMIAAVGSFFTYRKIVHTWGRLAEVLSTSTNAIPGD